jgi:integrase
MQAKITQRFVKTVQPGAADISITDTSLPGFELRVRFSGAKSWVFRYRLNGGPQRRLRLGGFPGLSAEEARKLALAGAADVAKGIDIYLRKETAKVDAVRRSASTLAVFISEHYEPWARSHLHTWRFQMKRIRSDFESWLDRTMEAIDTVLIEKWRAERLRAGNQPVTVNRNLQRLHALLSKAVEWKVIVNHPFAVKPLKTDRTGRVRYLEEDEEERLRQALVAREDLLRAERDSFNQWRVARHKPMLQRRDAAYVDHLRPLVLLALNTGMRRSELFQLRWADINLKTRWLTVRGRTAKSKQTRRLPLNREALMVLEGWHAQSVRRPANPYVFPGVGQSALTTITKSWGSLRKNASLRDFRFHDLRHHFASRLVQSGVDLNTVRELLGHADLKMVLRYAHLAPGGLASAVEKVARDADQRESPAETTCSEATSKAAA